MQNEGDSDAERQNAAKRQEETLHATIWRSIKEENSRRNKARRYFSKPNNRIAVLTFGVLVIYTLVTGALWVAQLKANVINAATYEASSRPWVMLTSIQPISLDSDNEFGVAFWTKIAVKNVGHSPAQNVSVSANLIIDGFDPPLTQAMMLACKDGQTGSAIIPGRPIFPDQTDTIDGDTPRGFTILADHIWAARAANIKTTYRNMAAIESSDRAQAWANADAAFPFVAPLYLVGCINYRSPDNRVFYQTSFIYGVAEKSTGAPLPLLSKDTPARQPLTPMPNDPSGVVIHARRFQRVVPGDQIKLSAPLYPTFAK